MTKWALFAIVVFIVFTVNGQSVTEWPVLKHYGQEHLSKIVLPIGGIGTGTVNIGGRGDLRQWEIMNTPAKQNPGSYNRNDPGSISPVFCLYTRTNDGKTNVKSLTGPLEYHQYESMNGQPVENHGLPRFRNASFDAAYPFVQVNLSDPDVPLDVKIKAFNPLIPGDADASGIPIAILRFVLTNKTNQLVAISVCGVMDNFIGIDGSKQKPDGKGEQVLYGADKNKNEFRTEGVLKGIYMSSEGVDIHDPAWGTIALTTDANGTISYKTSVSPKGWGSEILSFWDDFSQDGKLTNTSYNQRNKPTGALALSFDIPANSIKEVSFYITWHFPNRFAWSESKVGNYYTTQYCNAWDVIMKTHASMPALEQKTIAFVDAFISSDLPEVVKEAALFNLSTLRSQTVFRTEDGTMFGWEGTMDRVGSCYGSCTHVWNYEQATAFLFGDLSRSMRAIEFGVSTDSVGLMSFRTKLPINKTNKLGKAAADGQMGAIMKMYRDWQLSGDDAFLKELWPKVKRAMEFCWIKNGWDSDKDGVMEGCQHNTMDVEYFGPNPQMQLWYLGALRACEEMAKYLGDKSFAITCRKLFENGSRWTDENLFNGEYYIQQIVPPLKKENVNPLLIVGMGSRNFVTPDFQLGKGCLVDQLVGQYMAHVCGLGYLASPGKIMATLNSIMKYNYRENMWNHFNHHRSYVFDDEPGLIMAAYPSERPEYPFPYYNEVMTGFEYVAAVGMLYEGLTDRGILCIKNIRDRFDGRKRNPFDEAECGHHYARAMDSWAAPLAITRFRYSGVDKLIEFTSVPGTYFWSNGSAWGTVKIQKNNREVTAVLDVLHGAVRLKYFGLEGIGKKELKQEELLVQGQSMNFSF
ncbi:GH116 family glycosyl-hydrolase [Gaoshiqia sp. Z1-71]|uniref:GH116 family glycosyl-hydrolase n=1 Tax=Gaoshiqia hydrogeniformans TaxID=3290090 RepID=UPI003BF8E647